MKYLAILALLLLCACATTQTITVAKYPEMPAIEKPLQLNTNSCKFDMPRDQEGNIIKESNIFVGYNLENYNCYLYNMDMIKQQMKQYDSIIDVVNNQREDWIRLNKEEANGKNK